jgi:hypothetical protein
MKARLAFIFPLLIFFLGCSDEKMPRPTQKGAYTFGCKVNGKKWIPDGRGMFSGIDAIEGGFYGNGRGGIEGVSLRAYKSNREVVELHVDGYKPGVYPLDNDSQKPASSPLHPGSYGAFTAADDDLGPTYVTSSQHTGHITITRADTVKGIISGTFAFTAVDRKGKTIKVTAGRFDFDQNR